MGVAANNKFADKKPAAGAAKKTAKPKGMGPIEPPRNPMPEKGPARFRLLGIEEGFNEGTGNSSFKMKVVALDREGSAYSAGDELTIVFMQTGPGKKDYMLAVAGFAGYSHDELDQYVEFDPEGGLPAAAAGWAGTDFEAEAEQLIGRVADVVVSFGKPVLDKKTNEPTGDHYRVYKWTAVSDDDDDQDASPKITK